MKKYLLPLVGLLLSASVQATMPASGKEYLTLDKTVADAPAVMAFFSFWCPSCYRYDQDMGVNRAVKKVLPEGVRLTEYHVDFMGPLGGEMTHAWSVAILLNVEDKVRPMLFDAVQKTQGIRTTGDIRDVFLRAGVSASDYDAALDSFAVSALTARQRKLAEESGLQGVPALFVNGRYQVNPKGLNASNVNAFVQDYARTVGYLATL